jgi:hypothetical protein
MRLITVSLVAAGLYAISRRATAENALHALIAAYLHTTAATFLLTLLMWYEASTGWLAALWALFAFALAAIDRRFKLDDLRWQAHALAAITMLRCIGVNLHNEELWHGISVRLISLTIVAVIFCCRVHSHPDEWRARDFHHLFVVCFVACLSLLWYELDPLGRAVGWAVFGLVLSVRLLRKIAQYRYQAYVALWLRSRASSLPTLRRHARRTLWAAHVHGASSSIYSFVYARLSEEEDGPSAKSSSGPMCLSPIWEQRRS